MSDAIISVENLSKCYFIGHQNGAGDGLRHQIEFAIRNPLQWLRERKRRAARAVEEFWALKDLTFDVKQGEVVGIIGRNGAGKSTLLKILSRITDPTQGRIRIRGRVASLLEVGTGFHPELTGRENIFLNGAILGMTQAEIKRHFDSIVAFSEVEKFLDTPVKRYSSGMYVRLAFAVAAHLEPEILIVDEVLAVGDVQFQKKCLGKMSEVARGGRTVLFVSHNMSAVKSMTQRCVVLRQGQVICNGPTDEAIGKYLETPSSGNDAGFIVRNKGKHSTITAVRLLDESGESTDNYVSGRPFSLEIHFTTDGTRDLSLDLFLTDVNQTALATASTYQLNGVHLPETPGSYVCCLRLQPLLLASGVYYLNISTARVNTYWDHQVERALIFNVSFLNPNGIAWELKSTDGYGALAWLADNNPPITFTAMSDRRAALPL